MNSPYIKRPHLNEDGHGSIRCPFVLNEHDLKSRKKPALSPAPESHIWPTGLDPSAPSHRDPAFIEDVLLPGVRFLLKYYLRVEHERIENMPRKGIHIPIANKMMQFL